MSSDGSDIHCTAASWRNPIPPWLSLLSEAWLLERFSSVPWLAPTFAQEPFEPSSSRMGTHARLKRPVELQAFLMVAIGLQRPSYQVEMFV